MSMPEKICREKTYEWLEAIDADDDGNLYFTNGFGKPALYRHKRINGRLEPKTEEQLLWGFTHVGGVCIDHERKDLYLGVRMGEQSRILQIPLAGFGELCPCPFSLEDLKEVLKQKSLEMGEFEIAQGSMPNGVVFDPTTNHIRYSHEALMKFGFGGYVGGTHNSPTWKGNSPNGLAIDCSSSSPELVVSQFWKRRIVRLSLPDLKVIHSQPCGFFPDGITCLENGDGITCLEGGDVLAAAPMGGKIHYLRREGKSYATCGVIASGLDMPTDLVITKSSNGEGKSLFVTTTKLFKVLLGGDGNIFEVPNIREVLEKLRKSN